MKRWKIVAISLGLLVALVVGIRFHVWLREHEGVAVWLEGIALVAIFIWDRVDGNEQHRETIEQLKISRRQVEALESSERAWLMAEGKERVNIIVGEAMVRGVSSGPTSSINFVLQYRNAGRVPCWITEKRVQFLLPDLKALPSEPFFDESAHVDDFPETAAVGEVLTIEFHHLTCKGEHVVILNNVDDQPGENTPIVYGIIKYRDVFGTDRETRFGYQISPHGRLRRIRSARYNNNT